MKFLVTLKEIWFQDVEIEAENEEEAKEKASDGEGTYGEFQYSHTESVESVKKKE